MKRLFGSISGIIWVLIIALIFVPDSLEATTLEALQSVKITGVVTDESGSPVIGATVRVKNANVGTITEIDGHYSIDAPKNGTLIFSFIGYQTQEVAIKGKNTIDVVLTEDSQMLEETVVIGYGAVKKPYRIRFFFEKR